MAALAGVDAAERPLVVGRSAATALTRILAEVARES